MQLNVKFCNFRAAEYACKNWHYSKSMPAGKTVKIGVWEDGLFIGAILYALGSNRHIGSPYGLNQQEICELVRVALNIHKTPVTQLVKISIKMLKKLCPGIKLIVSYADRNRGHIGKIYQAGNWIYTGEFANEMGVVVRGKLTHRRTINQRYGTSDLAWLHKNIDPKAEVLKGKTKCKYLMPLDDKMKSVIKNLAKPYPAV